MAEKKELAKVQKSNTDLVRSIPNSLEGMIEWAEYLINAGAVPQKTPEDVVIVMQLAKELNMSFIMALSNVYNIQGKNTIGIHLWNGLLQTNGVIIELLEDCVPIYHIRKSNGIQLQVTGDELENGRYFAIAASQYDSIKDKVPNGKELVILTHHESMPAKIVDCRSTVKMTRINRDGTKSVATRSYCYHEAWRAGYISVEKGVVVGKDNWIYNFKDMLFARACTRTGKVTGPDYTLGFSEVSEIVDSYDDYSVEITEDGDTIPVEIKQDSI